MPGTHSQVDSSARCKQERSQGERFLPWLAENIRGKHHLVPVHQKQRASETTALDCRANERQSFFDNVELGNAGFKTASGSLCVQVYRTLNT